MKKQSDTDGFNGNINIRTRGYHGFTRLKMKRFFFLYEGDIYRG